MPNNNILPDREPVVSGRFYAGSYNELASELEDLEEKAHKLVNFSIDENVKVLALVCPHAGYLFSGTVAASAYNFLSNTTSIKRVFLLGSSHHSLFKGASIYYEGNYKTPLGEVAVDQEVSYELLKNTSLYSFNKEAHIPEHSLEVQLPFLQYKLKSEFKIIPILIGGNEEELSKKIAESLSQYFGQPENLFIISTDLSHYPSYNEAIKIDKLTIEAVCENNPQKLISQLEQNEKRSIPHLSTSMCGWASLLTLVHLTENHEGITYKPILYQNSGDIPVYGDKDRVVGYQSMVVMKDPNNLGSTHIIHQREEEIVLRIARDSIQNAISNENEPRITRSYPTSLQKPLGAFVSIYVDEKLRGCIGRIETDDPLHETIQMVSLSSALHDTRFHSIGKNEINAMRIEISILTPLKKINDINEIIPGKHGILIRKGLDSGTFLPQVAAQNNWSTETMLSKCSEDKAGIGPQGWKDADIYIYQAQIIKEK